jgi:hypothetical protein
MNWRRNTLLASSQELSEWRPEVGSLPTADIRTLNYVAALFLLEAQLTASCYMAVPMSKGSPLFAMPRSRRFCRFVMGFASLVIICILLRVILHFPHPSTVDRSVSPHSKTFVVASLENDDTSRLYDHLSDWKVERFVVNNPSAQLTVPKNKGREPMVYLT